MNLIKQETISAEMSAKALVRKVNLELAYMKWSQCCLEEFTKLCETGLPIELATNNCPEPLCCDMCGQERYQGLVYARVPMSHVRNDFVCEECLALLDPELSRDLVRENERAHREFVAGDGQ